MSVTPKTELQELRDRIYTEIGAPPGLGNVEDAVEALYNRASDFAKERNGYYNFIAWILTLDKNEYVRRTVTLQEIIDQARQVKKHHG